jgi:hypothetical protein
MHGTTKDWQEHWKGMPDFDQREILRAFDHSIEVNFRCPEDRQAFADLLGQWITPKTKAIWYPKSDTIDFASRSWVTEEPVNPRHPVYVISKGRWESRMTVRALEKIGVPYHVVVEPQERDNYAAVIDPKKILVLPFSNLGQGSIPARNWVWEHSISVGASWHWILDDNISAFYRMYRNTKRFIRTGAVFKIVEDFVDRYENVGEAGLNYCMFFPRKILIPPFYLNTRVYSCILLKNDLPHRWRGRYNEDTDLSICIMKSGLCTVLFNALLCQKTATMRMKGGNTDELYKQESGFDGRYEMAKSLKDQHPAIVRVSKKWGRWQHHVNYDGFQRTRLKLKDIARIPDRQDNYGMYLKFSDDCHDNRVLLIGQAPGQHGDPGDPLGGKLGHKIAKLAGIEYEQYLERTDRMNLFDEWTGKDGKGDAWDARQAKQRADDLIPYVEGRKVLFIGKQVAKAFGFKDLPWMKWTEAERISEVAVIPHLSGIVTWWNELDNRKAAGVFLKEMFAKGVQDVGVVEEEG